MNRRRTARYVSATLLALAAAILAGTWAWAIGCPPWAVGGAAIIALLVNIALHQLFQEDNP